jgi:hypothetical protein
MRSGTITKKPFAAVEDEQPFFLPEISHDIGDGAGLRDGRNKESATHLQI